MRFWLECCLCKKEGRRRFTITGQHFSFERNATTACKVEISYHLMITMKISSRKLVDWIVICVLYNSCHVYSCISINIYVITVLLLNLLLPHSPVLGARIAVKSMLFIIIDYYNIAQLMIILFTLDWECECSPYLLYYYYCCEAHVAVYPPWSVLFMFSVTLLCWSREFETFIYWIATEWARSGFITERILDILDILTLNF